VHPDPMTFQTYNSRPDPMTHPKLLRMWFHFAMPYQKYDYKT
jgi:hypothetical protein